MPLNLDAVGTVSEPHTVSWTANEALLYAIGVGAGQDDPLKELAFTTENSHDVEQKVLPVFGVILNQFRGSGGGRANLGDYDRAMLVHAEQSIELKRPLAPAGSLSVTSTVTGMYDKGSGALVTSESVGTDPETGEVITVASSSSFIRGEGGFGIKGPRDEWAVPESAPDVVLPASTRPDQALLYRLSGDHNPLHADPWFAARAGFPKPILHGMGTYGVVARVLLNALADGEPARFTSMKGRFSKPVFPGDSLSISAWAQGSTYLFRVANESGDIVLDRGVFQLTS